MLLSSKDRARSKPLNEARYELLTDNETDKDGNASRKVLPSIRLLVISFLIGVVTTSISFLCYSQFHRCGHSGHDLISGIIKSPGDTAVNYLHNKTFAQAPSPETEAAWRTILPNGLGFVQHPDIGPEIVGFAFVHQLHCLKKLHQGFYSSTNRTGLDEMTQHVHHCLEYLRQSIMCNADTNLERRTVNNMTGMSSVTGYGNHQCRDYDELFVFAERYRVWNGKSETEKKNISDDENVPGRVIHYDYLSSRGDAVPED